MCGERLELGSLGCPRVGSAQRVRGTQEPVTARGLPERFSPACAGNAACSLVRARSRSVQPRVCGERIRAGSLGHVACGSAPRVWGTPLRQCAERLNKRFSPACAGNACATPGRAAAAAVQPRVCGERAKHASGHQGYCGSAPRVRGTRELLGRVIEGARFSPACAGNAPTAERVRSRNAVQPRVCGERTGASPVTTAIAGSAPRVRGTPADDG